MSAKCYKKCAAVLIASPSATMSFINRTSSVHHVSEPLGLIITAVAAASRQAVCSIFSSRRSFGVITVGHFAAALH